jgi:hypothetical protein
MATGLGEKCLGQLIITALVLEQIINESQDDPRVGEPKRQLAEITDEINRRCPDWERKLISVGRNDVKPHVGIRVQLETAELRKDYR